MVPKGNADKTWTGFMRPGQVYVGTPQDLNAPEIPRYVFRCTNECKYRQLR